MNNVIVSIVKDVWPMLTIFVVVLVVTRLFYLRLNKKEFVLYKEVLALLFIVYLLILFNLVTNTDLKGLGVNLIPFKEILRHSLNSKEFFNNVIGNIIIFIPFGYFISSYVKAKSLGPISIITVITSLCIEMVQLKIGRSFDIDDIILNTVGSILGFLLFIGLSAIKKHLPGLFQNDFLYNLICIVLVIAIILYFLGIISFGWLQ